MKPGALDDSAREEFSSLVELERRQLGNDVHDDLVPLLYVARAAAERLAGQSTTHAAELEQIASWLSEAMQWTRRFLGGLQSLDFQGESLTARLTREVAELVPVTLELDWQLDPQVDRLPPATAMTAYRIVMEAIRNVVRHGCANRVIIIARVEPTSDTEATRHGVVSITDNGRGFEPKAVSGDHYGLQIMHSRAELVGGKLTVRSQPSGPTSVEFVF